MNRLKWMPSDTAARRLRLLTRTLNPAKLQRWSSESNVRIGNVSIPVRKPTHPELVPVKYVKEKQPQSTLKHLQWIMQKDALRQDVFLIGSPGPLRRALAMQYLELTKREVEYISLSRDTTEADLKQRREIKGGTAFYVDQCAVRAALEGRTLVLEGIEKAERNVLPVLNNLLENREMQLEDGRFLVSAERFDSLLKEHTKEELDSWKLVRVSEDFRVIALGLPVPRYHGNALDPPLRSRFQARDIQKLPFKDQLEMLIDECPQVSRDILTRLLSFAHTLQSSESSSIGLPDFPIESLFGVSHIMGSFPEGSLANLLHRVYPHTLMLGADGSKSINEALQTFHLDDKGVEKPDYSVNNVQPVDDLSAAVTLQNCKDNESLLTVPRGVGSVQNPNKFTKDFVLTNYHSSCLSDILQSHSVHDLCLVGGKGCGKSALIQYFADMLGYRIEPVVMYQDMTTRDLLQQRITLSNGDTAWHPSPLVTAALEGHLAVLDGIHRVNPGTLAVLQRLVHDRELNLFDGSRLIRHDRYELIKDEQSLTDQQMADRKVFPIHPSFRIAGLAEPPVIGSNTQQWLTPELMSLFFYHHIKPLTLAQEAQVIYEMVPGLSQELMQPILNFADKLRHSNNSTLSSISSSLSTRQLLRIAHRLVNKPENLHDTVYKACLGRFLPTLAQTTLDLALEESGIHKIAEMETEIVDIKCEVKDGFVQIGATRSPVYNPENRTKVPDVLFYENRLHLEVMEDMLKDFTLGEHLLLVGNQGVGKNKIVDRFLHLLNRPREYIQLHRDTTVQSLTLQPTVQDGIIIYEDSPLVTAVKQGHILVVDEADKAPTHVTCVLKTLVESGEMVLGDGRRLITGTHHVKGVLPDNVIIAHKDFRMVVLANRPGFPFLGNDFFGAMGDIFSCHAIDNPDIHSEMSMLRQYGPDVPEHTLTKLVQAFSELRSMADQGLIAYPYSTREVVNMVKHLQAFPDEGLTNVLRNVFDFDSYQPDVQQLVVEALRKHGIPVGASLRDIQLAKEFPLPALVHSSNWQLAAESMYGESIQCPVQERNATIKNLGYFDVEKVDINVKMDRSRHFSELIKHWDLPINESVIISDITVGPGDSKGDWLHVASSMPVALFSMQTNEHFLHQMDLFDVLPTFRFSRIPNVHLSSLPEGKVLLHESIHNSLLQIDPQNGSIHKWQIKNMAETVKKTITKHFKTEEEEYKICDDFSNENWVVIYQNNSNRLEVLNIESKTSHYITLPFITDSVHLISPNLWLVSETGTKRHFFLSNPSQDASVPYSLDPIESSGLVGDEDEQAWQAISNNGISPEVYCKAMNQENTHHSSRLLAGEKDFASIAVSQPQKMLLKSPVSVYTFPRENQVQANSKDSLVPVNPVCLPSHGQVVRLVPRSQVPEEISEPEQSHDISSDQNLRLAGYLEIVDIAKHSVKYIPIHLPLRQSWYRQERDKPLVMTSTKNDGLVTVDSCGRVALWETGLSTLQSSFDEWQSMLGDSQDQGSLQVTYERVSGKDVSEPKHGKVDKNNKPHVGGNTWAGGTGGRDTAGLGGKGGPYRLDAGHDVHQIPDWEKDAVPENVKQAAREMGQKAFKERLREIEMSEYDAELYEKFSGRVRRQVQSLRVILDNLQARGEERVWLRHQTSGDLDDTKLIDGLTGEKAVYKRRGEQPPEMGTPQQLPKRLRLVVDVSGSMYRFNSYDGRLERMMEAACLVMEAFHQYNDKIKYDIIGHSGDEPEISFVSSNSQPANNKQRLDVIRSMYAHSQFCQSGDFTLEAVNYAVKKVAQEEADEHIVVAFSDANLRRYGIRPSSLAKVLTDEPKVNAYVIFIGSLGKEAERLTHQLPSGRGFVCMDTKEIPQVLQQIFSSTMLKNGR